MGSSQKLGRHRRILCRIVSLLRGVMGHRELSHSVGYEED